MSETIEINEDWNLIGTWVEQMKKDNWDVTMLYWSDNGTDSASWTFDVQKGSKADDPSFTSVAPTLTAAAERTYHQWSKYVETEREQEHV